jgi:hypothetical protein
MKIFLTASIHGRKKYLANYQRIVELVEKAGHKIQASHVIDESGDQEKEWKGKKGTDFQGWVVDQIKKSDAVFAELSYTSTSVGYLVALAVESGKPVVVFFAGDEEPHIFDVLERTQDRLVVARYQHLDDLDRLVPEMIQFVSDNQDVRFNFFLTPKLSSYLDWISRTQKIPRSVYLRKLIDEDVKKENPEGVMF